MWLNKLQEIAFMCLTCGCSEPKRSYHNIVLADAHPGPDELVLRPTEQALKRAESWIGWNGAAVMSLGSAWTPHKALRRIADHLIDHLCQIEARAAGVPSIADQWHGRTVTLHSDWATFSEQDLDEATARIRRLAQLLALRLDALRSVWDGTEWTLRAIGEHVAEATGGYSSRPAPTRVIGPDA
jgi:hypothetical protein